MTCCYVIVYQTHGVVRTEYRPTLFSRGYHLRQLDWHTCASAFLGLLVQPAKKNPAPCAAPSTRTCCLPIMHQQQPKGAENDTRGTRASGSSSGSGGCCCSGSGMSAFCQRDLPCVFLISRYWKVHARETAPRTLALRKCRVYRL